MTPKSVPSLSVLNSTIAYYTRQMTMTLFSLTQIIGEDNNDTDEFDEDE